MNNKLSILLLNISVVVAILFTGCITRTVTETNTVPLEPLKPLLEVWEILQTDFVDKNTINKPQLNQSAILGLSKASNIDAEILNDLDSSSRNIPAGIPEDLEEFWNSWAMIFKEHDNNETPLEPESLTQAAIQEMITSLDDAHTSYIGPKYHDIEAPIMEGNYQGIGSYIYLRDGQFFLTPMPGSPSQSAGVKAGDILITVNGESVEGWTQFEAVDNLRGPKGTEVTIEVRHLGKEELSTISIIRGVIKIESIAGSLIEDKIGYIKIGAFYQNTRQDFLAQLRELQSSGAQGLIIDVRDNPGGLLSITNQITDEFLKGGIIAYQKDANGKRTDFTASNNGMALEIPLVVLVNNYSASGSEILAGAIQDYERGTIIGTTTLGKGTVNKLHRLSDGGSLYYSFARWYTPNGNMIEANGLEPDIIIQSGNEGAGDIQLSKGIEIINNAIKTKT
tara:strand:+ start:2474 stop:3826 length:1353 start_codon:yes stop_codon:yes gene_type:complete